MVQYVFWSERSVCDSGLRWPLCSLHFCSLRNINLMSLEYNPSEPEYNQNKPEYNHNALEYNPNEPEYNPYDLGVNSGLDLASYWLVPSKAVLLIADGKLSVVSYDISTGD